LRGWTGWEGKGGGKAMDTRTGEIYDARERVICEVDADWDI